MKNTKYILWVIMGLFTFIQADAKICNQCKKIIQHKWIEYENKPYHSNCYQTHIKPRCNFCNQHLQEEYYSHKNSQYHPHCFKNEILPKCQICLQPLENEYLVDAWGNPFHTHHEKEGIYCTSCSRIISETVTHGGYRLSDGRYLCSLCESNTISKLHEIRDSRDTVLKNLSKIGINISTTDIPITIVSRNSLNELSGALASSTLKGFTHYSFLKTPLGKINKQFHIYVLDRLPKIEFHAVLAHEYFHVWLFENSVELPSQEREGFCNLASAYIYELDNTTFSNIHLESMYADLDPDYGEGFRLMKKKLNDIGWENLRQTLGQ